MPPPAPPADGSEPDRGDRPAPPLDKQLSLDPERARRLATSIFAAAVEGILTVDEAGCIEAINPAATRMFGYAPEEIRGASLGTLMPAPFRQQHLAWLRTGAAAGRRVEVVREVKGLRKDGSVFPMELSLLDVLWDHQRLFVGIVRDISEKLAMQDALRRERDFAERLIDIAPAIVLVLDHEGHVIRFNSFFASLTGRNVEDVLGADWFETFVLADDRAWVKDAFVGMVRGERVPASATHAILAGDGRLVPVEWHSTRLEDHGRVLGVLSIGLDISERRRLEMQFLQAQKMEAVGRLAGGIAHDFNNLLMGIVGGCRMSAQQLDSKHPARTLLDEVCAAAERGVGLTRQLLTFTRNEPARRQPVDLNEVAAHVHAIARHLMRPDIEFHVHPCPTSALVVGDPAQVEQVLMNLIVNARDAMPNGGSLTLEVGERIVSASLHHRPGQLQPGRYVEVKVRDTGVGMDPTTQARVFEPFFTTKGAGKGTGLGLSTVFGIVSRMGGTVSVETAPGAGATFTVLLPQAEIAASQAPTLSASHTLPDRDGDETILLVEDDHLVRSMVREALVARGYRVLTAKDAGEALGLAAEVRPVHLLLTDVALPGYSGPELARRVRQGQPATEVLYMSAHPRDYLVETGKLQADEPALEKPFGDAELTARVRAMLDAHEN